MLSQPEQIKPQHKHRDIQTSTVCNGTLAKMKCLFDIFKTVPSCKQHPSPFARNHPSSESSYHKGLSVVSANFRAARATRQREPRWPFKQIGRTGAVQGEGNTGPTVNAPPCLVQLEDYANTLHASHGPLH